MMMWPAQLPALQDKRWQRHTSLRTLSPPQPTRPLLFVTPPAQPMLALLQPKNENGNTGICLRLLGEVRGRTGKSILQKEKLPLEAKFLMRGFLSQFMRRFVIAAFIVAGILLLGCVQQAPPVQATVNATATVNQSKCSSPWCRTNADCCERFSCQFIDPEKGIGVCLLANETASCPYQERLGQPCKSDSDCCPGQVCGLPLGNNPNKTVCGEAWRHWGQYT